MVEHDGPVSGTDTREALNAFAQFVATAVDAQLDGDVLGGIAAVIAEGSLAEAVRQARGVGHFNRSAQLAVDGDALAAALASSSSQDRKAGGRVWLSRWTRGILGPGEWMLVHDAVELERRRSAPGWEVAEFVQPVSSQDTGEREHRITITRRGMRPETLPLVGEDYALRLAASWKRERQDGASAVVESRDVGPWRLVEPLGDDGGVGCGGCGVQLPVDLLSRRSDGKPCCEQCALDDLAPASSSPSGGEGGGHRLKISLDAGAVVSELICPESGCEPVDAEGPPAPCWLRTWADHEDLAANYIEDLALGTFVIEAVFDGNQPIVRIVAPSIGARIETPAPGGEGRDTPAREEWQVLGIDVDDAGEETAAPEVLVGPTTDRAAAVDAARHTNRREIEQGNPPYYRVVLQRRERTVTEWVDVPAHEDGGDEG